MPHALERLTYLLGVISAVVAWSVNHLADATSADRVLAWNLDKVIDRKSSTLHLENLSRDYGVADITIEFEGVTDRSTPCKIVLVGHRAAGMLVGAGGDSETNGQGFRRYKIAKLPPGVSIDVQVAHADDCTAVPRILIAEAAKAEVPQVRFLESGLESEIIRRKFQILLAILGFFLLAFVAIFATSLANREGTK